MVLIASDRIIPLLIRLVTVSARFGTSFQALSWGSLRGGRQITA